MLAFFFFQTSLFWLDIKLPKWFNMSTWGNIHYLGDHGLINEMIQSIFVHALYNLCIHYRNWQFDGQSLWLYVKKNFFCLLGYIWVKQHFHFYIHYKKILISSFINPADIDGSWKVENKKQSFANNLSDSNSSGRSFMYIKKRSGPNWTLWDTYLE